MDNVTHLRQSVSDFAKTLDLPPFAQRINELVDKQAWEEAAVEEKRAVQKIANMWAIVQAVATVDSTFEWVVIDFKSEHFLPSNLHICPEL